MNWLYLLISILIVCVAHLVRNFRWSLFIDRYEKPSYKILLRSLSLGYIVNYFIPFKLGDLVRAFVAGRRMKNGKGFAIATVIVERCLDVIFVGVLFTLFYFTGFTGADVYNAVLGYSLMAVSITVMIVLAFVLRKYVKKFISWIASLFNEEIEEKMLRFFWALIWGFKDIIKNISTGKLFISTAVMWALYILSYWCFGMFLGGDHWKTVFFNLFKMKAIISRQIVINSETLWYGVFLLIPSFLLYLIAVFLKSDGSDDNPDRVNLIPHVDSADRKNFLNLYFSTRDRAFIENYLEINRKVYVLRDYTAGSNATTILCNSGANNFFRKYAFGEDGIKLSKQVEWIKKNQSLIPLPTILQYQATEDYCYYDMPYNSNAVGLFDYAHSAPKEQAWKIIKEILECFDNNLYSLNSLPADDESIRKYLLTKVSANVKAICESSAIKPLLKYEKILINGREYNNLLYYDKYLSETYLYDVFKNDMYSDIHGDLTIENIICIRNSENTDFYVIDPNTENVHSSPNLDYAKLLQSIHGNYEFLMAAKSVEVCDNRIDFKFIKSDAYDYLLIQLDAFLESIFSTEQIKSIYFHEIVHWLRLMPYKLAKNSKNAVVFFAGLLMVMDDVIKRYGE